MRPQVAPAEPCVRVPRARQQLLRDRPRPEGYAASDLEACAVKGFVLDHHGDGARDFLRLDEAPNVHVFENFVESILVHALDHWRANIAWRNAHDTNTLDALHLKFACENARPDRDRGLGGGVVDLPDLADLVHAGNGEEDALPLVIHHAARRLPQSNE
jgi:hypothetical protein